MKSSGANGEAWVCSFGYFSATRKKSNSPAGASTGNTAIKNRLKAPQIEQLLFGARSY